MPLDPQPFKVAIEWDVMAKSKATIKTLAGLTSRKKTNQTRLDSDLESSGICFRHTSV